MDFWMQSLDTAIEHFREACMFTDVFHRQAGVAQGPRCAAGGDQFHPGTGEDLSEWNESGFIGDRQKCTLEFGHNGNQVRGKRRGESTGKSFEGVDSTGTFASQGDASFGTQFFSECGAQPGAGRGWCRRRLAAGCGQRAVRKQKPEP